MSQHILSAVSELQRDIDSLHVLATVTGNVALSLESEPVEFPEELVKKATHFEVRAETEDGPVFYYLLWRGRQKLAVAHAPASEFFLQDA